jgi:putative acetyltransferase
MTWTIRAARRRDHEAILAVVRAAFSDDDHDAHEEVAIVVDTWAVDDPRGLELVAAEGDAVIGHVLGAPGQLGGRDVLGVAPLAVAPSHQREGIGSALMTDLLRRAEDAGWPLVVVLGNPEYYGRFGFEPAGPLEVVYEPVGAENPHFQVRRLSGYDPSLRGSFTYCWEAGPS